jgi:PleD family two-component response regulator
MEGKLWLDECYDSGIPGFPGTCFVIDLDISPLQYEPEPVDSVYYAGTEQATIQTSDADCALRRELPETLSVLFVDDDLVLRKLFTRSIKRVLPNWKVREVSNGETALKVCENESFDLIFMDQYM